LGTIEQRLSFCQQNDLIPAPHYRPIDQLYPGNILNPQTYLWCNTSPAYMSFFNAKTRL